MLYAVHPIEFGRLEVDQSTLTYLQGFGTRVVIPIVVWLIRSEALTCLVDTGAPGPEFTSKHHVSMQQLEQQRPEAALRRYDVRPEDVDLVIISHLHFDHASNNGLFEHAEFVVQRRELDYAQHPLPIHARGYQHQSAGFVEASYADTHWTLLDGDAELAPGLSVLLTPGHTPGLQAVMVETKRGKVILASDNVPLYANWRGGLSPVGHIPNAVHVDLEDYYASFDRLEKLGAEVVPSHDPAVLEWSA